MYVNDIIICTSDIQYMLEIRSRFSDRHDICDVRGDWCAVRFAKICGEDNKLSTKIVFRIELF